MEPDTYDTPNIYHAAWLWYCMRTMERLSDQQIFRQVTATPIAENKRLYHFPDPETQQERVGWYLDQEALEVVPSILFDCWQNVKHLYRN